MADNEEVIEDQDIPVDEGTNEDAQQNRAWNVLGQGDDEFEFYDEDEEVVEEPKTEVTQASPVPAQDDSAKAIKEGFAQLGQYLKQSREPAQPQGKSNEEIQKEWTELKANMEKGFYDDPVGTMEKFLNEYTNRQLAPVLRQMGQRQLQAESQIGATRYKSDPIGAFVVENYGDEITEEFNRTGNYDQAMQTVQGRHMTEIISHEVSRQREEETKVNTKRSPNKSPSGTGTAAGKKPSSTRIPASMKPQLQAEATRKGISLNRYIEFLKKNNPQRLKGNR